MNKGLKEKILALRASGMSYKQICKELQCRLGTVSHYCRGDKIQYDTRLTGIPDEKIEKIKELCITHTIAEVSAILNISTGTVKKYKDLYGITRICGVNDNGMSLHIKNKKTKLSVEERKKRTSMFAMLHRKNNKKRAVEYLGGKCKLCGYNKCIEALSFHHRNPEEKEFNISHTNIRWEKLKIELEKCVLLCHNCHDEVHAGITELK